MKKAIVKIGKYAFAAFMGYELHEDVNLIEQLKLQQIQAKSCNNGTTWEWTKKC